jgi:colicin import membrane protein
VASIRPNITYTDRDNATGNPRTEVEIFISPTGAILSAHITQSGGIKSFDEAVLRGIEKTGKLPRDVDGSVQPTLLIGFRPKD